MFQQSVIQQRSEISTASACYVIPRSRVWGTCQIVCFSCCGRQSSIFLFFFFLILTILPPVIQRINHYPGDRAVCFVNTNPLDSDLSIR